MERDDVYEYSLDHIHGEEEGKKIRKKFWVVIMALTAITLIELFVGASANREAESWFYIKVFFIVLTIAKAAGIVLYFMHLGDERNQLKWIILIPYISFISYLIFICLFEATSMYNVWKMFGNF